MFKTLKAIAILLLATNTSALKLHAKSHVAHQSKWGLDLNFLQSMQDPNGGGLEHLQRNGHMFAMLEIMGTLAHDMQAQNLKEVSYNQVTEIVKPAMEAQMKEHLKYQEQLMLQQFEWQKKQMQAQVNQLEAQKQQKKAQFEKQIAELEAKGLTQEADITKQQMSASVQMSDVGISQVKQFIAMFDSPQLQQQIKKQLDEVKKQLPQAMEKFMKEFDGVLKKMDSDGNKMISASEMVTEVFNAINKECSNPNPISVGTLKTLVSDYALYLKIELKSNWEQIVDKIISELDLNSDGQVSIDEFQNYLNKKGNYSIHNLKGLVKWLAK